MEKNAARSGTTRKRLLIFILFFCMIPLTGQTHGASIHVQVSSEEYFIDREFEIEIFIPEDSPYRLRNRDIPRLQLEQEPFYMTLVQSNVIPEFNGLRLRSVYRFTTTGSFTLTPHLRWKQQQLALSPLTFTVHEPPLSEQTVFSWQLCTDTGTNIPETAVLEQGTSYVLFLIAAFYSPGYTDSDNALPPELKHIECVAPENAVLERLTPDMFPPNAVSVGNPAKEAYVLAAFRWIPLKTGVQKLPEAQVFLTSGGKVLSRAAEYPVNPRKDSSTEYGTNTEKTFTHTAFAEIEASPDEDAARVQAALDKERAVARKIAEYRCQEAAVLFSYPVRRERKNLEAHLNIIHSLPIYPRSIRFAAAVLSLIFIVSAIGCFLKKKKIGSLVCIIAAFFCVTATGILFHNALQKQGVCIENNSHAVIRRIPETTGSIVRRLAAGESVIIVRKTAQWYYIRTVDGIVGWTMRESIANTTESM